MLKKVITLDTKDFDNADLFLELAMKYFPLPYIYAIEDKFGNLEVVKGSNIINSLIRYTLHKKTWREDEKYLARIEDTKLNFIVIRYDYENLERIKEIKEVIKELNY